MGARGSDKEKAARLGSSRTGGVGEVHTPGCDRSVEDQHSNRVTIHSTARVSEIDAS